MDWARVSKIEGWMEPEELNWLSEQAKRFHAIVELGSYLGRSTLALADTPGCVLAVDNWEGPPELKENPIDLFEQFKKNLAPELEAEKVVILRANHRSPDWRVTNPEMVFIDGDHSYEAVKADIERWRGVKLLCGHDYAPYFPGVQKAVQESFREFKVAPNTTIWYVEGDGNTTRTTPE